jgi:uncharacterized protein YdhG (YjbR/CyaY superfamily)
MTGKEKPTTIAEYIDTFPTETQKRLYEMLDCLRKAAPGAEEALKWGQPALSYEWILFQFAAHKNFISLYPTPSVIEAFEKELADYETSTSTIKFSLEKPLPLSLISKIVALRIKEAKNGVKWM